MNIGINQLGALQQLLYSFKHSLNLADKNLLTFRTPFAKTGQIRRCQERERLGAVPYYAFILFLYSN